MKVRVIKRPAGEDAVVADASEVAEQLPEGWASCTMGDVSTVVGGGTPKASDPSNFSDDGYPWIGPADLTHHKGMYIERGRRSLSESGMRDSSAVMLPPGTVLFSSRAPIGHVAVARGSVSTNQGFRSFLPRSGVVSEYLYFYLRFATPLAEALSSGTTFPEISGSNCARIPLMLPPTAEQRRIAEAVETLLARVEAARARLDRVPAILKRFRQSVLAAACSGRLTEDWRAEHDQTEHATHAIQRAQDQTRQRYQAACEAAHATGQRRPPRPKVLDPEDVDSGTLAAVPLGWLWTTFDHVAEDITVGHVGSMITEYVEAGIPFLRSLNVREFRFEPTELKFISPAFHARLAKSALRPGDVAIVRTGNPGVACVIPPELPEANCSDLVILRPSTAINAHYAIIFLNSREARARVDDVKVGIAQGHFNVGSMRTTPVPLPPLEEQQEIVRRVEALFALADAVERRVAVARKQADALPQAILARAFGGKLVPTEAELARREGREYEPGSVLLERIRQERAESTQAPRPTRRRRPTSDSRA